MFQMIWKVLQPSTRAASTAEDGRLCRPARMIIKINGVHCQMSAIIMAGSARSGDASHS